MAGIAYFKSYYQIEEKFSILDGILFKGTRIVVPKVLWKNIVKKDYSLMLLGIEESERGKCFIMTSIGC